MALSKNSKKKIKKSKEKLVEEEIPNQLKFLRDLVNLITGTDFSKIADVLYGKKRVNEFVIAEKLEITINKTRNILYKLLNYGLVSFTRKKDKKNGGWYTYFWTLNIEKSLQFLKSKLIEKMETLENSFKNRSSQRFYYCPSEKLEYTEEEAMEYNFICKETGEVLELKDNSKLVDDLKLDISNLKETSKLIDLELEILKKKREASISRRLKKEAKEKAKERKRRRIERAKERKKEEIKKKKPSKKPVKKTKKKLVKKTKKKPSKKPVKKTKKKLVKKTNLLKKMVKKIKKISKKK
jgi:transcription initiation factor TFIIE subunit alpha